MLGASAGGSHRRTNSGAAALAATLWGIDNVFRDDVDDVFDTCVGCS
jgi:hypothetical protein